MVRFALNNCLYGYELNHYYARYFFLIYINIYINKYIYVTSFINIADLKVVYRKVSRHDARINRTAFPTTMR